MMREKTVVLGAGLVGICTSLSLAERGVAVDLIDRGPAGQETSSGNAGVISPWSIIPQALPGLLPQLPKLLYGRYRPLAVRPAFWLRMLPWGLRFLAQAQEPQVRRTAEALQMLCGPSITLFRRHLDGTGQEGLLRDSLYVHAFRDASRANLNAIDYRIRREKGADLELVGADRLRQIEPALSHDFGAAVLIKGQARALSPGRIGTVLAEKAAKLGVHFRQSEIRSLRPDRGGWVIDCGSETLWANRVVVAMGAWSTALLAPLGIRLPMVAERGYHAEFSMPGIELNNSVMDMDGKFVASSMQDGLRVAGYAEFASVDAPPDPQRHQRLIRQAKAALPGLDPASPRLWMGRRPSFPDSLPALGEIPGHKGLYAAFGHSHYGVMMAPATGEYLADLLTRQAASPANSAFSPSRFFTR